MAKRKLAATSDVYTGILALALLAVFCSAVFVAIKCGHDYGWSSLIKIAGLSQ